MAEPKAEEPKADPMAPSEWPPAEWPVGMRLDAKDKHGGWYEAKLLKVEEARVRVHFKGWGKEDGKSRWDEWMAKDSPKMAALGTKSGQQSDDDDDDETAWVVAKIVSKRSAADGSAEFRVSWEGRDTKDNAWVTEERLRSSDDLDAAALVDGFIAREAEKEARREAKKASDAAKAAAAAVDYASQMTEEQQADWRQVMVLGYSEEEAFGALKAVGWSLDQALERLLNPTRNRRSAASFDPDRNGDFQAEEEDDDDDEEDDEEEVAEQGGEEHPDDESEAEEDEPLTSDSSDEETDDDSDEEEESEEEGDDDGVQDMDEDGSSDSESEESEEEEEEPVPEGWQPETWTVGYMCDALDTFGDWFQAKVIEVEDNQRVKIHFQGWPAKWDEWLKVTSERLAPHKLRSSKEAKAKRKAKAEAKAAKRAEKEEAAEKQSKKDAAKRKRQEQQAKKRAKDKKKAALAKQKQQAKDERQRARDEKREAKEAQKLERQRLRESKKEAAANKGPKRPTSAYFFYASAVRPTVQAEHPDDNPSMGELSKIIGQRWKEMDDEAKAQYNAQAAEDKERYAREKAEWDLAHPAALETSPAAGRPKKKAKRPRAPSAYNLFHKAEMARIKTEQPELAHKEAFRLASAAWSSASDEVKAHWKEEEAKEKVKFDELQASLPPAGGDDEDSDVEEEHWPTLWKRLQAKGWRQEDGKRVGTDVFYVPPGVSRADAGTKNRRDYFDSKLQVRQFLRPRRQDDDEEEVQETKAERKARRAVEKEMRRQAKLEAREKKKRERREAKRDLLDGIEGDEEVAASPAKQYMNPKKRWKQDSAAQEAKEAEAEKRREKEAAASAAVDEQETEQRKKKYRKQLAKLPPNVLELMYIKRTTLLSWLDKADFGERVTGCMGRVCEPQNHRRSYQMGIVTGVFDFRTPYQVDWAGTCKGLVVTRAKTKGVLRLEALSNLDCELEEVAALFAAPEINLKDPFAQMMKRYQKQEAGCYGEAIKGHLDKLKRMKDKYNSMGDRSKMAQVIEQGAALRELAAVSPIDYKAVRKLVPDLKPVPGKFHIKDEFIWEQLLQSMKTTNKLVPSAEERSPRAPGPKRRRDDEQDERKGKRGRESDQGARRDERDRNRDRDRDRDGRRDRDRERDRGREKERERGSVWDRRDDQPLKKVSDFRVSAAGRGAAATSMADQGYSRSDQGYSSSSRDGGSDSGWGNRGGQGGQGWGASDSMDRGARELLQSAEAQIQSLQQQLGGGPSPQQHMGRGMDYSRSDQGYSSSSRDGGFDDRGGGHRGGGGGGGGGGGDSFPIAGNQAGMIIGKGGATITDLQSRSGAHIMISKEADPQTGDRMVTIEGTPQQIVQCKAMIQETIQQQIEKFAEQRESVSRRRPSDGDYASRRRQEQEERDSGLPDGTEKDDVIIQEGHIGLVIGKGGAMIRGLTERSGAHISLQDREYPIVNDDRVLRLSGMPEQIAAARQEILDLIAKAPPIEGTHHPVPGVHSSALANIRAN